MAKRPDARALLFEKIRSSPPRFVHVTGVPYAAEEEVADDPDKVDHVWITLEVPPLGRIRLSINTLSRLSRSAGVDPRIRVAIVGGTYTEKPLPGLLEDPGQDYRMIEAAFPVSYQLMEQAELTQLLIERGKRAVRAEVWGELYAREHLGVHQIHSRRASTVVQTDLKNRDGALKLYYATENLAELFLFKFAGQP